MKFPKTSIDKNDYLQKMYTLIEDNECKLFIDTNILGLFYRINSSARAEFFKWLTPLIESERVKIPIWAIHEYSNKFIRKQLNHYSIPLDSFKVVQRSFNEVSSVLKMHLDNSSLKGTVFGSLEEYHKEIDGIKKNLEKVFVASKSPNEDYINDVHNQIQKVFESTIIQSDLSNVLLKVSTIGSMRYQHNFPPGFEDQNKGLNAFGDLIIWQEILDYCNKSKTRKAILITNDNKKDWVYAPSKILDKTNLVSNNNPQFKIVDPRLVYEFKCMTDSEEFHILNIESLTQIVINNSKGVFIELAKALQVNEFEERLDSDFIQTPNLIQTPVKSIKEDIRKLPTTVQDKYSDYALADFQFPLDDTSLESETILNLKTYNWYIQNPAIYNYIEHCEKNLDIVEDQDNQDKLFVIGRNIYQAACGGANAAIYVVENFLEIFRSQSSFVMEHLYSGMLYEIYFNSQNEFREYDFKSTFFNEVFNISSEGTFQKSLDYIEKKLFPYSEKLLFMPSSVPQCFRVNVVYNASKKHEYKFVDLEFYYYDILDVKVNDISLITENVNNAINLHLAYYEDLSEIIGRISLWYLIPYKYIISELEPYTTDRSIKLLLEAPKFLKKFGS